jgi:hypothetical protein
LSFIFIILIKLNKLEYFDGWRAKMNYLLASLLMILSIALTPFSVNAAENSTLKTIILERYFGQDNYNYKSRTTALSAKDKSLYIAGQVALPHKTKKQNSGLFAWGNQIRRNGNEYPLA